MGKTKGFLYAIQHREVLMTDLGLYLKANLMDLTNSAFKSPQKYIMMNQFK